MVEVAPVRVSFELVPVIVTVPTLEPVREATPRVVPVTEAPL